MRTKTPSYVLELKLNTSASDRVALEFRFSCGSRIYNVLVKHCRKQMTKLRADKSYRSLLRQRAALVPEDRKGTDKALSEIRKSYGLTEYALHAYVVKQQHRYKKHIDANTAQKIASAVWSAVSDCLFGDGEELHFHREISSMEGKTNNAGIRFCGGKLRWNGIVIQPRIRKKDTYAQESLKRRVKYCRILRRKMGTGYHYYLQLILEGVPPQKHTVGSGRCGIDIGPTTIAIVTDHSCQLEVLGEGAKRYQDRIAELERQIDRSKRATNPDNYLPDGTIRKGRLKWKYSRNYRKLKQRKAILERKDSASLRQAHEIRANALLAHADEIFVEKMDMAGLTERSKEDKVGPDGRPMRKKRFGKSVENHAPSAFLAILDRKLHYQNKALFRVDTTLFRASQYDHISNTYRKKHLDERSTHVGGHTVQRDLYSAFLLMNSKPDLESTDRAKCISNFSVFIENHDTCIEAMLRSERTYPSSFGLADFAA